MFKSIRNFITWPWRRYQQNRAWKKRLEELKKRDPFIYK